MDEKLGKFIDDFAALVQLAQSGNHRQQAGTQLLQALTAHLGVPADGAFGGGGKDPAAPLCGRRHCDGRARRAGPCRPAGGHRRRGPAAPPVAERHGPAVTALSAVSARPAGLRQPGGGPGQPPAGRGAGPLAFQLRRQARWRSCSATPSPRPDARHASLEVLAAGPGYRHGVPGGVPAPDGQQQRPQGPGHFPGDVRIRPQRRGGDLPPPAQPPGVGRHPARTDCCRRWPTTPWASPRTALRSRTTASTSSAASCSTAGPGPAKRTPCGTC